MKTQFSTGATRDSLDGKPRTDLLPYDLLLRVSEWYGMGAEKYGDNNWRKGQKVSHCVGSIMRHLSKYVMGQRDEDHLSAIIFNALSIMNVETYHKDNKDIYDLDYSSEEWFNPKKQIISENQYLSLVELGVNVKDLIDQGVAYISVTGGLLGLSSPPQRKLSEYIRNRIVCLMKFLYPHTESISTVLLLEMITSDAQSILKRSSE